MSNDASIDNSVVKYPFVDNLSHILWLVKFPMYLATFDINMDKKVYQLMSHNFTIFSLEKFLKNHKNKKEK